MSTILITAPHVVDVAATVLPAWHPPAAGGDVFSWGTDLASNAKSMLKAVGGVLAVGFVIWAAVKARGAMAGVLAGAAAAVLFFWILNNVAADSVQDKIKNTVTHNGMGPVVTRTHAPAAGHDSPGV